MKKQEEKILSRSFDGKLDNFENAYERHFEQKHLKAYLKGKPTFTYGRTYMKDDQGNQTGMWYPTIHKVKQSYFMIPNPRIKANK